MRKVKHCFVSTFFIFILSNSISCKKHNQNIDIRKIEEEKKQLEAEFSQLAKELNKQQKDDEDSSKSQESIDGTSSP